MVELMCKGEDDIDIGFLRELCPYILKRHTINGTVKFSERPYYLVCAASICQYKIEFLLKKLWEK